MAVSAVWRRFCCHLVGCLRALNSSGDYQEAAIMKDKKKRTMPEGFFMVKYGEGGRLIKGCFYHKAEGRLHRVHRCRWYHIPWDD